MAHAHFSTRLQKIIASRAVSRINAVILPPLDRFVFRLTGGRTSALAVMSGLLVINMTTIGAKSGQPRTNPLLGIPNKEHPGQFAITASNWGKPHLPGWYFNLKKQPIVRCTIHGTTTTYHATEITGAEYDRLWSSASSIYAGYLSYQARAQRHIPIFMLTPEKEPALVSVTGAEEFSKSSQN